MDARDVRCRHCGEPWERAYISGQLKQSSPEDLTVEGWEFGNAGQQILRCPCCRVRCKEQGVLHRMIVGPIWPVSN